MKLSHTLINRMIACNCSKTEINFVCYIARFQTEDGFIPNLYYKHVIADLGIHTVTFYRLLHKLECKSILTYDISGKYGYYNIQLLDNNFSEKDYSQGYVNVNKAVFSEDFFNLKATEKYVVLKLLMRDNGREREIKISEKTICSYANIEYSQRTIDRIVSNIKDMEYEGVKLLQVFAQDRRGGSVYFFKVVNVGNIYSSAKYLMQSTMFERYLFKNKIEHSDKDIVDLVQMDNQYIEYNSIYKETVVDICQVGKVLCKSIRSKMEKIIKRIRPNSFGIELLRPIV